MGRAASWPSRCTCRQRGESFPVFHPPARRALVEVPKTLAGRHYAVCKDMHASGRCSASTCSESKLSSTQCSPAPGPASTSRSPLARAAAANARAHARSINPLFKPKPAGTAQEPATVPRCQPEECRRYGSAPGWLGALLRRSGFPILRDHSPRPLHHPADCDPSGQAGSGLWLPQAHRSQGPAGRRNIERMDRQFYRGGW
jgi:hypothetical protein